MAYMLEAVVGEHGTAPSGQIEGYRVGGQDRTAQRANPCAQLLRVAAAT